MIKWFESSGTLPPNPHLVGINKKGKIMKNKNHVITRNNIEQEVQKSVRSDVVIPDELGNGDTCNGLRHWRLLSNLKNNFSKPVRNDMDNKSMAALLSRQLNKLDCFASARNDKSRHTEDGSPKYQSTNYKKEPSPEFVSPSQLTNKFYPQLLHTDSHVSPQLNGSLCITKREGKKNRKELIDFKKAAFTLAETLITLGIIGVVAAITIPMLRSAFYEKQTVSRLLETQSILSQAIKSAEEEYGEVGGWDITGQNEESAKVIADKVKPFLKFALDCGGMDAEGKCFSSSSYKTLNGYKLSDKYSTNLAKYKFVLLNGSSVLFQPIGSNLNNIQVNIDVNGPSKPNIVGKDLFLFQYNGETRSLYPMGAPSSLYPYQTYCTKNSTGWGCAYYVTQFQNMKYLH